VEIQTVDDTIMVTIDNRPILRYTGPKPSMALGLSFECLTTAPVYIDDVEIWGFGAAGEPVWVRTGETGEIIPIFCLTIDPSNPDIVWAGTTGQRGVFKSIDGGNTWERRDNGIVERSMTRRGFSVDPKSSDIVYAAGEISSWEWNGGPAQGVQFDRVKGAIYKTIDGGRSWRKATPSGSAWWAPPGAAVGTPIDFPLFSHHMCVLFCWYECSR